MGGEAEGARTAVEGDLVGVADVGVEEAERGAEGAGRPQRPTGEARAAYGRFEAGAASISKYGNLRFSRHLTADGPLLGREEAELTAVTEPHGRAEAAAELPVETASGDPFAPFVEAKEADGGGEDPLAAAPAGVDPDGQGLADARLLDGYGRGGIAAGRRNGR